MLALFFLLVFDYCDFFSQSWLHVCESRELVCVRKTLVFLGSHFFVCTEKKNFFPARSAMSNALSTTWSGENAVFLLFDQKNPPTDIWAVLTFESFVLSFAITKGNLSSVKLPQGILNVNVAIQWYRTKIQYRWCWAHHVECYPSVTEFSTKDPISCWVAGLKMTKEEKRE